MKRRKEREFVLQLLYAMEYNPQTVQAALDELDADLKKYSTDFALRLIQVCQENKEQLEEEIKEKLINWDMHRVAVIDKLLLRIAMAEFLYFEDIPPEVTLNETIEISKDFSTERSGKFINGLLDAILKKLREQKRLKKSGRGLVSRAVE